MHYLMPKRGILSLHSGCNIGHDGDVTLFFGLSGEAWLDMRTCVHALARVVGPQNLCACIRLCSPAGGLPTLTPAKPL